jgi:hypothetical protein
MNNKRWRNAYFCKACNKELSKYQYAYSDGRCPLCGVKSARACTFVDCYEKAKRYVITYEPKWYEFWKKNRGYKGYWEYKDR